MKTSDGSWAFVDPCLTTSEAKGLALWLRQVAQGVVSTTEPNAEGNFDPDIFFTEPNLAFGVGAQDETEVTLRLYFSLESAPPWLGRDSGIFEFYLELPLAPDQIMNAAASWELELAAFPER